jgi:hypothetical protein
MMIDTSTDNKLNASTVSHSAGSKESDFTVVFLKDQLKFLTDQIKKAT